MGTLNVAPYPPCNGNHANDPDDKVKSMEQRLERIVLVPLLAEPLTDISEAHAPWKRTQKRVNHEATQVHFRDACWKGNERSYRRQQPAGENDQLPPPGEPSIGNIEIV